MLHSYLYS
jgi:hypothetical protein